MAVTAYPTSGQLALSEFRTTVVGASDSVSMSKLVRRAYTTSTTTTDIQYFGTNVPWSPMDADNNAIPTRTAAAPTPAISISDFHGALPYFYTRRANMWKYASYVPSPSYDKNGNLQITAPNKDGSGGTTLGAKLTWDNVLVHTLTTSFPSSISTGGFTYYADSTSSPAADINTAAEYKVYRIGRD